MKKKTVIILFSAALLLPTLIWLFFGGMLADVVTFDIETEMKRDVYAFPDSDIILSGGAEFFAGVENWYGDRLPFYAVMMRGYKAAESYTNEQYGKFVRAYTGLIHTHRYTETVIAPTCTEGGKTVYVCECGDKYEDRLTDPVGHAYAEEVIAPTCAGEGYTLHTCTVCGDSYRDTETAALAHTYTEQTVAPTCTEDGYTLYTCTGCGREYKDGFVDATGHTFEISYVEPTEEGGEAFSLYTCAVCGETHTEEVPVHTHDWVLKEKIEATCTEDGYDLNVCSVCGVERETNRVASRGGHSFGGWTTTRDATLSLKGEKTRTCKVCGEAQTEELPCIDPHTVKGTTPNGFTVGAKIDKTFRAADANIRADGENIINSTNDWILYSGNSTLADYQGSNLYAEYEKILFMNKLNKLNDLCASLGKTLVFTVTPNKERIYGEYMEGFAPVLSEKSRVDLLMEYLGEKSNIKIVYEKAVEDLEFYKQTYRLWFKHDTHWNAAGGFVWAMNLLDTLGLPSQSLYEVPLEEVSRYQYSMDRPLEVEGNLIASTVCGLMSTPDLYGDINSYASDPRYKDDVDYIVNYRPDVEYTVTSHFNRRGDNKAYFTNPEYTNIVTTSSNCGNDLKCCFLGDSFRRSLNLFLCKSFAKFSSYHYREITAGDWYGKGDDGKECLANICEADIIVIQSTERCFDTPKFSALADILSEPDLIARLSEILSGQ